MGIAEDKEDIVLMIDDCMNREAKMYEWEQNFIENLSEKSSSGLTKKQIEKLHQIWERIT